MKATVVTCAIAAFALTAAAAEQAQSSTQPQQTPAEQSQPALQEQVLSTNSAAQQQDSPLVRAAKATGRLNKKPTNVITNDTLLKAGGHFTTTTNQEPLPDRATQNRYQANAIADAKKNAQKQPATAKAKTTANKDKDATLKRAVADYAGESIENVTEDPATQEGVVMKTAPKTETAAPPAKPPLE